MNFITDTMEDLEEMISAEGETVTFSKCEQERSGREFSKAAAQYDKEDPYGPAAGRGHLPHLMSERQC